MSYNRSLKEGEPCDHIGCLSHLTHPCEGCGRINGKSKAKVITDFGGLMRFASALGKAKQKGDPKEIEEAQQAHDIYKEQCLNSDEMLTGFTFGSL
jgi:hypothetical protein